MSLCFPQKVLDAHAGVLGKTGAGKSSAMRHVVEHLLDNKKRVAIIDPKGDWWGLKASPDGKGAGYPIVTFGDFKSDEEVSDVPINENSGKHLAELVTDGNRPAIIGFRGWYTSHMLKFWIDFAKGVFHNNAGEFYLFIDEVQNFAPKGSTRTIEGQGGLSLHWTNRLLAEGRGLGINIWIGSQRPQKVHNDTLDGCETLVAMRSVHPAARNAIGEWLKGAADKEKNAMILDSLGSNKRGEAIIWSPEIEFGPQKVAFPMFSTFDSFAPPQLQKKVHRKGWADVDLAAVREKMAAVIEETKANDPKELRRQLGEARTMIARQQLALENAPAEVKEVPVLKEGDFKRLEKLEGHLESELMLLRQKLSEVKGLPSSPKPPPFQPREPRLRPPEPGSVDTRPSRPAHSDGVTSAEQRVLDSLAWWNSAGIPGPTRHQAAFVARYTVNGHFNNIVGGLRTKGLIDYPQGGGVSLTVEGGALATAPASSPTRADLIKRVTEVLRSEPMRRIFTAVVDAGQEMTREELATASRYTVNGHFNNIVGSLHSLGVIEYPRGGGVVFLV